MIIDFAERAHNHNWDLDPVVRSLLDTDFYKLLMLQFIWKHFPTTQASFTLMQPLQVLAAGRDDRARRGDATAGTRAQPALPEVGADLACRQHVFRPPRYLRAGLSGVAGPRFPPLRYRLTVRDGEFHLQFDGLWTEATMWEIYALSILNELKTRAAFKGMSEFELDILYAQSEDQALGQDGAAARVPELRVGDFGTRRRHSFLWQEYVVNGDERRRWASISQAHRTLISPTSTTWRRSAPMPTNCRWRWRRWPTSDEELKSSQYRILELWQSTYGARSAIMLPDTFGTTQFLADAPDWTADWTGQRIDSKDPYIAGDEYIAWLERRGRDPKQKLIIASDAMDVEDILGLHAYFMGAMRAGPDAPGLSQRGRPQRPGEVDSGAAHPFQRRLGHAADQRFSRLPSEWRAMGSTPPA